MIDVDEYTRATPLTKARVERLAWEAYRRSAPTATTTKAEYLETLLGANRQDILHRSNLLKMGCPKDVWGSVERGEIDLTEAVAHLRRQRSRSKDGTHAPREPTAKLPSLDEKLQKLRTETIAELDKKLASVLREHKRSPRARRVEAPRQCPEALKPWLIDTNAELQRLLAKHDFFACDYGAIGNATNDFFLEIDEAYRTLVRTINSLQGKRQTLRLGSQDILLAFHALGFEEVDLDNAPAIADVKTRYRTLTRRLHPDRTGSKATPTWHKVLEANNLLMDWYDRAFPQ